MIFNKRFKILLTLGMIILNYHSVAFCYPKQKKTSDSIYHYMKLVSDWQWNNLETEGWKNDKKDWTNGAMFAGMMEWARIANDDIYYKKLIQVCGENKWKIGKERHFADDYCVGQTYSQLYTLFKNPEYIRDFKQLADSLTLIPHTESLLWVNDIYLREWAWCDALFMAPPALVYLTQATGDLKYLNTASNLWWKTSAYLYDEKEHLFFRDSRYFGKKEKNGEKVFWSRGNGWVMGGLVRILSVMPHNHPDRTKFITQFKEMAARIADIQQADGAWYASLLDPKSYGVKETSGTGFFCYALAWGINQGILDQDKYLPVVTKAWNCLTASVHPDGKLGFVQAQGSDPQSVSYDDTEVYGTGAFLLAGTEMLKLSFLQLKDAVMVTAANTTSVRKPETIEVPWESLKKLKALQAARVVVENAITGEAIPSKVIYNKQKKVQKLIFKTDINYGTKLYFLVKRS
jgi:unsaturated rhamnogalacturonyl hydrolase